MLDHLLSAGQQALRAEVRDLVRAVPRDLLLAMDRDEVDFPRELLREAGRLNLMGVRYPVEVGGRGLDWPTTCMVMEEVMGGIGYTNVYPVERTVRDLRLASIWTGTSEVMAMIVAHEWGREVERATARGDLRDPEPDAAEAFALDEKIYE